MKRFVLCIFACLLFLGCASVEQIKLNFTTEKISDYELKISGTELAENLYLRIQVLNSKRKSLSEDIEKHIKVLCGSNEYKFVLTRYDTLNNNKSESIACFDLHNKEGEKVNLTGFSEIRLISEKAISYKDVMAAQALWFINNNVVIYKTKGAGKKNDCYIGFIEFSMAKNTKEEIKKNNLANDIIEKQYPKYKEYKQRTDFNRLYRSLLYEWSPQIDFEKNDIIVAPEGMLSVVNVIVYSKSQYLYLVSVTGMSEFSKCCYILSDRPLNIIFNNIIYESLILKYTGKSNYQKRYDIVDCYIFTVSSISDPDVSKIYKTIEEVQEIEKNPDEWLLKHPDFKLDKK